MNPITTKANPDGTTSCLVCGTVRSRPATATDSRAEEPCERSCPVADAVQVYVPMPAPNGATAQVPAYSAVWPLLWPDRSRAAVSKIAAKAAVLAADPQVLTRAWARDLIK